MLVYQRVSIPKDGVQVINGGVRIKLGHNVRSSSFILQEVKKLLQGSNPRAFVKLPAPEPVAVIFPGLPGIEYVGMLRDVHEIPVVKDLLSQAKGLLGVDLLQVCLTGPLSSLQERHRGEAWGVERSSWHIKKRGEDT
eukprot:s4506_g5.t1